MGGTPRLEARALSSAKAQIARTMIQEMASLPLGAVRLTEEFLPHDPPKAKELHRLRAYITEEIHRIERRVLAKRVQATIATGGTAEAAAKLVRRTGGEIIGAAFVIDLPELGGTKLLESQGIKVHTLMAFAGH